LLILPHSQTCQSLFGSTTKPIYLDHAATSPCPPNLLEAFVQYQTQCPWNSETVYDLGLQAKQLLEQSRQGIAELLGVKSERLVFTSGGTEGNNFAAQVLQAQFKKPGVIWVSLTAHPSQTENHLKLAAMGWKVVALPTLRSGAIDVQALENLPEPQIISVEWVNSEVGFIQDLAFLCGLRQQFGALLWVDGVQGLGKCPLPQLNDIDIFVFSGHKCGTPIGVGGVVLNANLKKAPLFSGGGQENGWRSGTVSVPLIATLKDALTEAFAAPSLKPLPFSEAFLGYRYAEQSYSPYITMLSTAPVDGEILLHQLAAEGIFVGLGSACRASRKKASAVHKALGLSDQQSRQTLRVSFNFRSAPAEGVLAVDRIETLWNESKRFYR
jgi:cysteine desulfurase